MKYHTIFLYCALVVLIIAVIYLIFTVRKNEKRKKTWIKDIQLGDNCKVSPVDYRYLLSNCEIVEIDDDNITVEIKTQKRFIYPVDKKKKKIFGN